MFFAKPNFYKRNIRRNYKKEFILLYYLEKYAVCYRRNKFVTLNIHQKYHNLLERNNISHIALIMLETSGCNF